MKNSSINKDIKDTILDSKSVCVIPSKSDPDSIGSALAMYRILTSLKKDVNIKYYGELGDISVKFPNRPDNSKFNADTRIDNSFDLLIFLDGSKLNRFNVSIDELNSFKGSTLSIDHHEMEKGDKGFTNYLINDPLSDSTCELIVRIFYNKFDSDWLNLFSFDIDTDSANDLLVGMYSDNCIFRYKNSKFAFLVAQYLIEHNANNSMAVYKVFQSFDINSIDITKLLLNNLKFFKEEETMITYLTLKDVKEFDGYDIGALSEIYSQFITRCIYGYKRGYILKEIDDKNIQISARGNNYTNDIDLTEILGDLKPKYSGGHFNAAGSTVENVTLEELTNLILSVTRELMQK